MCRMFWVNSWFIVLFEFKPLLPIRNRYYFRFYQHCSLLIVSLILCLVFEISSYINDYFFYSFDVSYRFYYIWYVVLRYLDLKTFLVVTRPLSILSSV